MSKRKPQLPMPPGDWRPVPQFEGYYWVSTDGRIFTQPRVGSAGGLLKVQRAKTGGYPILRFYRPGFQRTRQIHKIVMEAFVGQCPKDMEVRHLDGDPLNCTLANLVYGTHSENELDKVAQGTHQQASKTHCPQGHPYDSENTYVLPSRPTARYCRACKKPSMKAIARIATALHVPQISLIAYAEDAA